MTDRRSPPPWSVEEQPACFVGRDHNGQALAYVYFEDGPPSATALAIVATSAHTALKREASKRLPSAAKLLTRDEARRIAVNIAKLPEPLRNRLMLMFCFSWRWLA